VLGVDYTRTAESVSKRGVDVSMDMKTDLSALFMPRQPPMDIHEAVSCMISFLANKDVLTIFN